MSVASHDLIDAPRLSHWIENSVVRSVVYTYSVILDLELEMQRSWVKVLLMTLMHAVVLVLLYLAFSFSLFLGLQVRPMFGNAGLLTVVVLVCCYVYFGWVKPIRHARSRNSDND